MGTKTETTTETVLDMAFPKKLLALKLAVEQAEDDIPPECVGGALVHVVAEPDEVLRLMVEYSPSVTGAVPPFAKKAADAAAPADNGGISARVGIRYVGWFVLGVVLGQVAQSVWPMLKQGAGL